jgi:hypothetical protein
VIDLIDLQSGATRYRKIDPASLSLFAVARIHQGKRSLPDDLGFAPLVATPNIAGFPGMPLP